MTAPLIETRNLVVSLRQGFQWPLLGSPKPRVDILPGLSLTLRHGEILCMVGESGSGKTTFGKALLGLANVVSGEVLFEGKTLADHKSRSFRPIRRRAALLFQDPVSSFDPRQRIRSVIAEPRRIAGLTGTGHSEIAALAARAGLPAQMLDRFAHALSGGQARRAAVARALSAEPSLIIADEPTAGLDVSVQGGVLNLFQDIRASQGTAFLIITHNLAVARLIADRIVILYLGRVVEEGEPDALFAAPLHPYTRALLHSEPVPDPMKRRSKPPVLGEVPAISRRPQGCEFHTRCPHAADLCRAVAPSLSAVSATRSVACHFPLATTRTDTGRLMTRTAG